MRKQRKWTAEEEQRLRETYATTRRSELERIFGRDASNINAKARRMGLVKTIEYPRGGRREVNARPVSSPMAVRVKGTAAGGMAPECGRCTAWGGGRCYNWLSVHEGQSRSAHDRPCTYFQEKGLKHGFFDN